MEIEHVRFDMATVAETAYFPSIAWGTVMAMSKHEDHITTLFVRVPEGLLYHTHCDGCGGRVESLLDMREVTDEEGHRRANDMAYAKVVESGWVEEHKNCDNNPIKYELTGELASVGDRSLEYANAVIGKGKSLEARMAIFSRSHVPIIVPLSTAANEDVAEVFGEDKSLLLEKMNIDVRTMIISGRYAGLRDAIRANDVDVTYASIVAEATETRIDLAALPYEQAEKIRNNMGEIDPDNLPEKAVEVDEKVSSVLITHDFALAREHSIERASGVPGVGHGKVLDDSEWHAGGTGRLIQGVMVPTITPLTDERLNNAADLIPK